jgi:phenylpropionate dioxygenase-like ring-hydroxylating dioxygenase large terminal subunit
MNSLVEARTQSQYLDEIKKSADNGLALPAACYRDPAFFDLELELVLRPGWHPVVRWDSLSEAGDFSAIDLFGEPLVIVRGDDKRLRVFSNVCRHRAHTVANGSGNAKSLVCPYHRWTYGLDGALRGAPLMDEKPGFDRARCGLLELPTESWQGFLLVSLDPEPAPFGENLAGLDKRIESFALGEMVTLGVLEFDSPWNWKVMVDNFMESYHHLGIHTETLQKSNPAKNTYGAEVDGPYALLENPGTAGAPNFIVAQIFPSFLFAIFEGEGFGTWYEMKIDRHDHIHLRVHALAPQSFKETPGAADSLLEAITKVHLEDIPACEAVQRGIASQLWQPGPLSHQESCLVRFHQHLADRMSG